MSLLTGDDYPEAFHPPDPEQPAPAGDLRRRPGPRGKRHDWSRWRGRRRRSMLIQDPPDLAGDGEDGRYGVDDSYSADNYSADNYSADAVTAPTAVTARTTATAPTMATRPARLTRGTDSSPILVPARTTIRGMGTLPVVIPRRVISRTGLPRTVIRNLVTPIFRIPGRRPSVTATLATRGLATRTPVMPGPAPHIRVLAIAMLPIRIPVTPPLGIPARRIPADPGHAHPGASDLGAWYETEGDDFRAAPALEDHPWDDGQAGQPELGDEPPGRRAPLLEALFRRREPRYRDAEGPRKFTGRARRLGGILLASASAGGHRTVRVIDPRRQQPLAHRGG